MGLSDLLQSLTRPDELLSMLQLKFTCDSSCVEINANRKIPLENLAQEDSSVFVWNALVRVSRSFARVIQVLPKPIGVSICVFYLVLRALDTIEDDMKLPLERKLVLLRTFHLRLTASRAESLQGIGDGDEATLLQHFDKVVQEYSRLPPSAASIICDIARRMATGMALFSERRSVATLDAYDWYCHFVAGLVGHGLTLLFNASSLEAIPTPTTGLDNIDEEHKDCSLANHMGVFLQKTNIIRDYREDLDQQRTFWPQDVWSAFVDDAAKDDLGWFAEHPEHPRSIECLNALINDVLASFPRCLAYLESLTDRDVFEFCAVPQAMALATLVELASNPRVFTSVVKIRKGQAAKLMLSCTSMQQVRPIFHSLLHQLRERLGSSSTDLLQQLLRRTEPKAIALPRVDEEASSQVYSWIRVGSQVILFGVTALTLPIVLQQPRLLLNDLNKWWM